MNKYIVRLEKENNNNLYIRHSEKPCAITTNRKEAILFTNKKKALEAGKYFINTFFFHKS